MKRRNVLVGLHVILPTLLMIVLAVIAFSAMDDLFTTEIALTSLVIYYPLLFIIQGAICSWLRANIFVSLGSSVVGYLLVLFIWLNSSASIYLLIYIVVWFVAYGVSRLIVKG